MCTRTLCSSCCQNIKMKTATKMGKYLMVLHLPLKTMPDFPLVLHFVSKKLLEFSQTQVTSRIFRTINAISHLAGLYVKTMWINGRQKIPQREAETHHCSDVSILSLLTRRAGQTLQRRQTFLSTKKERSYEAVQNYTSQKNPQLAA